MSVANVNYLYNNQQFLKVFNFVSFFFPNKLFLVHSISVEQSLGGVTGTWPSAGWSLPVGQLAASAQGALASTWPSWLRAALQVLTDRAPHD